MLNFICSCVQNCEIKVIPSERLRLKTKCTGASCVSSLKYSWRIYVETIDASGTPKWRELQDLDSKLDTLVSSSNIAIKIGVLEGGALYKLNITAQTPGGTKGSTEYRFATNSPPTGGTCGVNIPSGEALKTEFTLSCNGWTDSEGSLMYEFKYRIGSGTNVLLYYGQQSSFTGKLPTGEGNQRTVNIDVRVSDPLRAANYTTIKIQVRNDICLCKT